MAKRVVRRVLWVGRGTATAMGLAVILAMVVGVASAAFGDNGDPWILGQANVATAITKLVGDVNGPAVRLVNNNADANDRALDLQVQAGEAPMSVNSSTRVANLNADQLDGKDFTSFDAQEVIDTNGPLPRRGAYTSKGGTLVISASGSGWRDPARTNAEGLIGMDVYIDGDGSPRGRAGVFTNERNSHKAFVDEIMVVEGLPAGGHTIRLEPTYHLGVCSTALETNRTYCTSTDLNDLFSVTVTEIPG